ncbi:MAG: HAMP domain-containing protein [Nitrospirae bacterium]|nr:HAMP domain-containing protein [Nitrospirota bacterium]
MKIREKLLLAFGFYMFLAVLGGLFTYNELRTITKRLIFVEIADDITNTFLEVRRHEKNFLLFKDKDSLPELKNNLGIFKKNIDSIEIEIVKELGRSNYEMMKKAIAEYEHMVNKVAEDFKLQDSIDTMRLRAREIQSFTETFSKKERADINKRLKLSFNLLSFALLTVIILGAIVNIKLARGIATPIRRLEEITKKIAAGDFSVRIEIKGKDEIASLESSVNIMEDRLQDTMRAFEFAIERLHEKQAQLVETEKLATLGKFAAGVAHEINNPLAIINEKAGLIKDVIELSADFPNRDKFLNILNSISDSVNRCRVITHRILGFARKTDVATETINLNNLIGEVLEFIEKELLFKSIHLEINLAENLPELEGDTVQLEQVFLNIIKNAIDAVEKGGLIKISTNIKNENTVRAFIEDNGHGIPEGILKHIFEPFFTTKVRGKGTGLGLSITYGIIKRLGGDILVKSEVNKGTTFTVEIPVKSDLPKEVNI